jgi:LAS superfamily LD-carboxypeptidase LdcB
MITGCRFSSEKEIDKPVLSGHSPAVRVETEKITVTENVEKDAFEIKNEAWINAHVDKDFLLGKVKRKDNPLFVQVDKEHTERNIYLIHPVYEAYKKMYEAALSDGVKLVVTSGHRLFWEQVCEWELRWNDPRTDRHFSNDVEKARFVLQYRSMPGTSRHHWGTDIDLNSINSAYFQTEKGEKVYKWLRVNAANYGFVQSYTPKGEKRPFGYEEEKWHWSYKPLARHMLVKYLELVSISDIRGFKGDVAVQKLPVISEWVCGINPEINEK